MTFYGQLRPFQEEAFERMIERKRLLVAYEMGLGKTILSIAAIEHLLDEGEVEAGLIIVPSALKYQWRKQIAAFTKGEASVVVVDGTPLQREAQYAEILEGGVEYTILNYEQVVNDWDTVKRLTRDFIVLDEAQAIKSLVAKRSKRIKKLDAPYRFALSGQPVENRPEEVFSIMQWVDEDVLGRFDVFDKTFIVRNHFGKVKYYRALPLLHESLAKAMVRKTRHDPDVSDQMPAVTEEAYVVPFDPAGAKLYRHIANDLLTELGSALGQFKSFDLWSHYHGGEEGEAQGRIMSRLTCLRMLCDHPELLRVSAAKFAASQEEGGAQGSAYAAELAEAELLTPTKSPKMVATVELIKDLLEADPANKIVLFAFFKDALAMIADETAGMTQSVLFTGDMSAKAKDAAKEKFLADPKVRLFLSSDAGGYGVDLPNSNYLISYDLPWSAGKLDQRNARIIRLSSEFDSVTLIYMMMEGSVEERQYDMLTQKQAIGSAVMDGKGFDRKTGRLDLDLKSLSEFLATSEV